MPYAIYILHVENPTSLDIDLPSVRVEGAEPIIDTRFVSFGKTPQAVHSDLFLFIADQQRLKAERRVPDDLELMYQTQVRDLSGVSPSQEHLSNMKDIELSMAFNEMTRCFSGLRLEVAMVYDANTEDLIDDAREIVRDREVTIALARVANPSGRVMDLNALVLEVDRTSRVCCSMAAAANVRHYIAELDSAVRAYAEFHQSMRWLPNHKQEA